VPPEQLERVIGELEQKMREAAKRFEFEKAAQSARPEIKALKARLVSVGIGSMRIVVLVGLPGSGKSTYVEKLGVPAIFLGCRARPVGRRPHDQSIHARCSG